MTKKLIATLICAASMQAAMASEPVGWVMLGVNVRSLIAGSQMKVGAHESFVSYAIRNLDTKTNFTTGTLRNSFYLFEVPPGTYCVNEVRTYSNQDLPLCRKKEALKFVVRAGEVTNLGYWILGVQYDGPNDRIRYQRLDAFVQQRLLAARIAAGFDPEAVARARAAHPPLDLAHLAGSIWYETDADGELSVIELAAGGTLVHASIDENGSTVPGVWRVEGDAVVMEINDAYATMRGKLDGPRLVGWYTNKDGHWAKWIATRDPFEYVEYGDGVTLEPIWQRRFKWPEGVPKDGPPGSVTVAYDVLPPTEGRLGTKPASLPRQPVEVLRSEPPGLYDALAVALVENRRYAPMKGPDGFIAKRVEETITFPLKD